MDWREILEPLNVLPPKCSDCGFPDIECVPQPYYIFKSRSMSPNEMSTADMGNFFVRDRVRKILEVTAPGLCEFFPTYFKGTSEVTPWFLAVPRRQVVTATVKSSIERCPTCGEPKSAHPGSQWVWSPDIWNYESEFDVLKSATWGSSDRGWQEWISRDFFISMRLFHLLKELEAKGLVEGTCNIPKKPDEQEKLWICEQMKIVERAGIALHPPGMVSDESKKWFRAYLKSHACEKLTSIDFKAAEKKLRIKLPKSYTEFLSKVGPARFEDINDEPGFHVNILVPDEFDAKSYRAGVLDSDDETNAVNGVMFAASEHGDCFCFDVRKDRKEYEVFVYKHEYNCFEPYAQNFAACIQRFAEKSQADES